MNRVTGGQILAEKVCGQNIDKSGSFVTAASVETKFDAGIFNVGGSVDTKLAEDIVTTLEPEHFLLFSTYTNGRLRFDDDPMKIKSRAHDLSFVAECDKEGRPDVGYYIIIYNPELPSGHFYVDARKVRRTYLSTFRTLGFTPSDDPDEIESGRFWRIWGVDQYFAWRTALRYYIQKDAAMQQIMVTWDPEGRNWISDFFAHLVMMSAFNFEPSEA